MIACVNCKHCKKASMASVAWCGADQAIQTDRVFGSGPPFITSSVTDKCDKEGWYEPKPVYPWWWIF